MAQLISVKLSRFDGSPWGFRLQGGKDFGTPLIVQKVNGGSPAEAAGLRAGDAVIKVNSTDMYNLRHKDAQDVIVRAGNNFEMTVQRGGSTWRPSVTPLGSTVPSPQPSTPASCVSPVTKTSLAAHKKDTPLIGSGHNFSPKPFLNGSGEGHIKSIVNKQYNSPVGIYSEETIAETLSAQAEVLAGGVLGVNFKKNEKNYNAENSEVFKMVQEADKEPRSPEPVEPHMPSGVATPSSPALAGLRPVSAPETKPRPTTPQSSLPPGQNICADCERLIVGVFVRIKEKNLHVECFKCSTCGTSLKNVGYYNINNKLYCDIHAKMVARQNAPAGMVPMTIPPTSKAPASTISSALSNMGARSPPVSSQCTSPLPFSAPISQNIGVPKPFGGSSINSSYLSNNSYNNLESNTLPRAQSQTVTERYYTECDTYEVFDEIKRPTIEKPPTPKPKTAVWPPQKPIEDITYPTASPIYIDPNSRRQSVRDRKTNFESTSREQYSRRNSFVDAYDSDYTMDNVSCSGPTYRKVEVRGRRETRRSETVSSRASSTESLRRSLTPTRITQPTPTPWTATVTTNSSVYQQPKEPEKVCKKYRERHMHEEITDSDHEEKRSYCEKYMEVSESEPEPEPEPEMYTCTCVCTTKPAEPVPEPEPEPKGPDYSKLVPPDVAVCPKGIEGEHDLYTETTEKDVGDFHIKRTTTYEKTVELVSPDEAPQISKTDVRETVTEKEFDRSQIASTVDYVSSKIDTSQMVEHAKHADEEEAKERELKEMKRRQLEEQKRWDEERRRREEEERRRREEEQRRMKEEEEKKWRAELEMRVRKQEEEERRKKVSFSECSEERIVDVKVEERQRPPSRDRIVDIKVDERPPSRERVIDVEVEGRPPSRERIIDVELEKDKPTQPQYEKYEEIRKEVQYQESKEEQRRQSLREQVQVHQSLREQQVPEKRQTLQERRLSARFQKSNQEQSENTETTCKKHVQFIKHTERGPVPLPATPPVKNSTPKEWKSPMLSALTTAPERAYSPFSTESNRSTGLESTTKQLYSREVSYEERYGPPEVELPLPELPPKRPASPFQEALVTAPERPITPLGEPDDQLFRGRAETPTFSNTTDGYCPPAQLLHSDIRHRECTLSKRETPRPLPTPPPDFQLRSRSISPSRSRPPTPRKVGGKNEALRKPDVIPSYQRNLITVRSVPLDGQTFDPSRTPTPTPRCTKSPAPGPPEVPACMRAQAPRVREETCRKRESTPQRQSENVHYHWEEDTPSSHKSRVYTKHVNFNEDDHSDHKHIHQHQSRESSVEERFQENGNMRRTKKTQFYDERTDKVEQKSQVSNYGSEMALQKRTTSELESYCPEPEPSSCYIEENTSVRVTLPCPVGRPSGAEKFPRTGVRVLPPLTPQQEVRRIAHEVPKEQPKCPETGVQVIPCKAYSDSGHERAGVVIVPCEGGNTSCKPSGVCITPSADRSALCVSPCPAQAGGICEKPSCYCGAPTGACNSVEVNNLGIDTSNCQSIGVSVKPCPGGSSFRVESYDIPGVRPVQAPKPILKPAKKPNCPFPQIPLPAEGPPSSSAACPKGCSKACPPQSSGGCDRSFEPIHKPRTNLGSQLTRLTTRPVNKPTIQLYKPTPQPQPPKTQQTYSRTEFMSKTETSSSCQDQNHCPASNVVDPPNLSSHPDLGGGFGGQGSKSGGSFAGSSAPKRGKGILNQAGGVGSRQPLCAGCKSNVRGPFISALGQIWCPEHFICVNPQCNRQLQDIGFVEEKGQLYCEYCFERFIAPACNKCNQKVKGDCLNAIGKTYHPECFNCAHCGKLFGNNPFFLEEGLPYCEGDWNNLFTTKCFACGFPVEAGDRWVEALNNNYHSQCFNCTMCKKNLEGQSFYAKGGRPFCKNHAR